ncbi:hypothetical protein, partial [Actinoalloteichus caeruleus]
ASHPGAASPAGLSLRSLRRRTLLAVVLLDEPHLSLNPVAIGADLSVSPSLAEYARPRLVGTQRFAVAITAPRGKPFSE